MPYVHVDIDPEDFDDEDLIEELESRGYAVIADAKSQIENAVKETHAPLGMVDLEHIEHLAVCGQLEAARVEALQLVSAAIGRTLQ